MLEDGAHAESEIAVAPIYKDLISLKLSEAVGSRDRSASNIEAFQELIFDDGRTIAGVLNRKERTFHDLLPVLEKASEFRRWLQDQEPTSNLVREYFRSVTKGTWIEKLPSKILRWSVFTGAGLIVDALGAGGIGTAIGAGISAVDAFIVDKLVKGWRPNGFVDNVLMGFVRSSPSGKKVGVAS
jgi:hypothetical protein